MDVDHRHPGHHRLPDDWRNCGEGIGLFGSLLYRLDYFLLFQVGFYTVNGHGLHFFESPHPSPLPQGEGEKAAIRARVEYS